MPFLDNFDKAKKQQYMRKTLILCMCQSKYKLMVNKVGTMCEICVPASYVNTFELFNIQII